MVNIEVVQQVTELEIATAGIQGTVGPSGTNGTNGLNGTAVLPDTGERNITALFTNGTPVVSGTVVQIRRVGSVCTLTWTHPSGQNAWGVASLPDGWKSAQPVRGITTTDFGNVCLKIEARPSGTIGFDVANNAQSGAGSLTWTTSDPFPSVGNYPGTAVGTIPTLTGTPLYGTGSPEGVHTAPVGSEYIDTAKTNGAFKWIKDSGTGNTGWKVVIGDTGWRNVSSTLQNGWAGSVFIRRAGLTVEMRWSGLAGVSATNTTFMYVPSGFRDTANTGSVYFTGTSASGLIDTAHAITLSNGTLTARNSTAAFNQWGAFTWTTLEAWPTSLPGTAV